MSDFSSIGISPHFSLLPEKAKHVGCFQSKDLPDDPTYGACIDGEIDTDGRFIRTDSSMRTINPNLDGWIRLVAARGNLKLIARLKDGVVVEMREAQGEEIHDHSQLRGAYFSPNTWQISG
jgi:hypothetical protein